MQLPPALRRILQSILLLLPLLLLIYFALIKHAATYYCLPLLSLLHSSGNHTVRLASRVDFSLATLDEPRATLQQQHQLQHLQQSSVYI